MAASSINDVVAATWPTLTPAEVVVVLQSAADMGRTATGWTKAMTLAAFAQYLGDVYTQKGRQALLDTLQPFVTTVVRARGVSAATAKAAPELGKIIALVALTGILGYFAGKGFGRTA